MSGGRGLPNDIPLWNPAPFWSVPKKTTRKLHQLFQASPLQQRYRCDLGIIKLVKDEWSYHLNYFSRFFSYNKNKYHRGVHYLGWVVPPFRTWNSNPGPLPPFPCIHVTRYRRYRGRSFRSRLRRQWKTTSRWLGQENMSVHLQPNKQNTWKEERVFVDSWKSWLNKGFFLMIMIIIAIISTIAVLTISMTNSCSRSITKKHIKYQKKMTNK